MHYLTEINEIKVINQIAELLPEEAKNELNKVVTEKATDVANYIKLPIQKDLFLKIATDKEIEKWKSFDSDDFMDRSEYERTILTKNGKILNRDYRFVLKLPQEERKEV
jgi:hypothetical protein